MVAEPDIERAREGPETWNAWAAEHPQAAVDFSGATLDGFDFSGFVFPGEADFQDTTFAGDAKFAGAIFRGAADFNDAVINGDAEFFRAIFHRDAVFENAVFSGDAWFLGVIFHGRAEFFGARFAGDANLYDVVFRRNAVFSLAAFKGSAAFFNANFQGDAQFDGARFAQALYLPDARFAGPPNFRESILPRTLDLDEVEIGIRRLPGPPGEVPQVWRALKRLAAAAGNRGLELDAFARELAADRRLRWPRIARQLDPRRLQRIAQCVHWRWRRQRPSWRGLRLGGLWWWRALGWAARTRPRPWRSALTVAVSKAYELSCDYGRSLIRPVVCWLGLWAVSALLYRLQAPGAGGDGCGLWSAAGVHALATGLPLPGLSRSLGHREALMCLCGDQAIPSSMVWLGAAQTSLSLMLAFLFALTLRNLFRIR